MDLPPASRFKNHCFSPTVCLAATAALVVEQGFTGVEDVVISNDRPIGVVAQDVMTFLGWG